MNTRKLPLYFHRPFPVPSCGSEGVFQNVRSVNDILDHFFCIIFGVGGNKVVNRFQIGLCRVSPDHHDSSSRFRSSAEIAAGKPISGQAHS